MRFCISTRVSELEMAGSVSSMARARREKRNAVSNFSTALVAYSEMPVLIASTSASLLRVVAFVSYNAFVATTT